jgi:hypothetical protein
MQLMRCEQSRDKNYFVNLKQLGNAFSDCDVPQVDRIKGTSVNTYAPFMVHQNRAILIRNNPIVR